MLSFVKPYSKFLFSKLNLLLFSNNMWSIIFLVYMFAKPWQRKMSKFILKSNSFKKTRKIPKKTRSSHRRCSLKRGTFKNFAKFTGKHLCRNFFFNKVTSYTLWKHQKTREYYKGVWPATLLKKRFRKSCFPVN